MDKPIYRYVTAHCPKCGACADSPGSTGLVTHYVCRTCGYYFNGSAVADVPASDPQPQPQPQYVRDLQGIRAELSALVSSHAGDTALGSQLIRLSLRLERIIGELRSHHTAAAPITDAPHTCDDCDDDPAAFLAFADKIAQAAAKLRADKANVFTQRVDLEDIRDLRSFICQNGLFYVDPRDDD